MAANRRKEPMRYFVMSVGGDGKPAPDKWITDWGWDTIPDSHLCNWWDAMHSDLPRPGDIAVQASTVTVKLLGIFRVIGEGEPHPFDPRRWPYGTRLEPLVLWDGRYAPTMASSGLGPVTQRYRTITGDHMQAMEVLIRH